MSDPLSRLSPRMRDHIEAITRRSGLLYSEESLQRMAAAWLEKKEMFEQQTRALSMREVQALSEGDPCGALALTYSGSLISVEPAAGGMRRIEYASIPLRVDVPGVAVAPRARLDGDLRVDGEAAFMDGPVKSTSQLLRIAVCSPDVPANEQRDRIREAMIFLTNGFMKINRTVVPPVAGAGAVHPAFHRRLGVVT